MSLIFWVIGDVKILQVSLLTLTSEQGKLNSLTYPKSSPVARAVPRCDRWAQFTSALLESLGQIPTTSFPSTLIKGERNCCILSYKTDNER